MKTMEDLPAIKELLKNDEDKTYLTKIMETLTSRI